jgi:hypothetical protein
MAIDAGEKITLQATFTDSGGVKTDPSTPVTVTVAAPSGGTDVDEATASQDSTGVYTYSYAPAVAGLYRYKFTSADGAIKQDSFLVIADRTD